VEGDGSGCVEATVEFSDALLLGVPVYAGKEFLAEVDLVDSPGVDPASVDAPGREICFLMSEFRFDDHCSVFLKLAGGSNPR